MNILKRDRLIQVPSNLVEECICPICLDITENPIITQCLHIFCNKCITEHMGKNTACPLCKRNIFTTREEKARNNLIQNFEYICPCNTRGFYRDYINHLKVCTKIKLCCCGDYIFKNKNHICNHYKCEFCKFTTTDRSLYKKHTKQHNIINNKGEELFSTEVSDLSYKLTNSSFFIKNNIENYKKYILRLYKDLISISDNITEITFPTKNIKISSHENTVYIENIDNANIRYSYINTEYNFDIHLNHIIFEFRNVLYFNNFWNKYRSIIKS